MAEKSFCNQTIAKKSKNMIKTMYSNIVNVTVISLIRGLLPVFMSMLIYIGIIAALKMAIVLMRWRK